DLFTTLDGVAQGPGGPEEDTSDSFPFGGWQAPLQSEAVGASVGKGMETLDALLLGRRTYDSFAGYWPNHTDGPEGFIGQPLDRQGSTRVGGELAAESPQLRERHQDRHRSGSVDFAQARPTEQLYDELQLRVYPTVLGQRKKVFPDGAAPHNRRLLSAGSGD